MMVAPATASGLRRRRRQVEADQDGWARGGPLENGAGAGRRGEDRDAILDHPDDIVRLEPPSPQLGGRGLGVPGPGVAA